MSAARIHGLAARALYESGTLSNDQLRTAYRELAESLRARVELVSAIAAADESIFTDALSPAEIVQSSFHFVVAAARWFEEVADRGGVVEVSTSEHVLQVIADEAITRRRG